MDKKRNLNCRNFWTNDEKPDALALFDNYRHKNRHADGHGVSITDPGQRAELVTI